MGHVPDHYLGFADAFPDVKVYALEETKAGIEKEGLETLKQRQAKFGAIIAKTLRVPVFFLPSDILVPTFGQFQPFPQTFSAYFRSTAFFNRNTANS